MYVYRDPRDMIPNEPFISGPLRQMAMEATHSIEPRTDARVAPTSCIRRVFREISWRRVPGKQPKAEKLHINCEVRILYKYLSEHNEADEGSTCLSKVQCSLSLTCACHSLWYFRSAGEQTFSV